MTTKLNPDDSESAGRQESIREMVDAYVQRVCETFMKRQAPPQPQEDRTAYEPGRRNGEGSAE